MQRNDFVLASLSTAGRQAFSPVQVQKLFFLLDKTASPVVGGPYFSFAAYDYGPFDKEVYHAIESISELDLVRIIGSSWDRTRLYQVTDEGISVGAKYLNNFPREIKDYTQELCEWVLSLSFSELVSAIYNEYPEMRANSVFRSL